MKPNPEKPAPELEEYASTDDAAVGRGVRISLGILAALAVLGGVTALVIRSKKAPETNKVTQLNAPMGSQPKAQAEIPTASFTDVTESAGIRFQHQTGAYGDKLLPETMGSGVAFTDLDGDGSPDLLFVNGTAWPGKSSAGTPISTAALYRNDGKGHFTEVTAGSGIDIPLYGMGVAVGDIDNDGRPDLFISTVGGGRLFRNEGQFKFKDITASSGVAGNTQDWSTACTFFDLDNDGDLDLYVGNYVRWSPEIDREVNYTLVGVGRAYGPPMNFEGTFPHLYRNDGKGHFTDISEGAGVRVKNPATGVPVAKTLGVSAVDYNHDGWMDLIVANDTTQNLLFENQKNGTFKEVGALSGIAFDSYGNTRGAMGVDSARFTSDGKLGIGIGNFANEMTALYVENGVNFTDESIPWGIGPASRLLLKFGFFFFDYDLDGRLDVLTSNGHLEEEISKVQASQSYRQPAQLFWNAADDGFLNVATNKAGSDLFTPIVGRGSAYADMDGDGDLDLVLTQTGGKPKLIRNDQKLGHHFLRLRLMGTRSNRDALGAWVQLKSGGLTQWRQVSSSKSYLSASEVELTFGLGKSSSVDSLEIHWPSGAQQTLSQPRVDSRIVIEEPQQLSK